MSGTNGNGNGSPKYFAMLRMETIEHKIGLGNPIDRIYFAIIRCSICYPHQKPFAVRPEVDGSFEKFVAQLHERIKKQRVVTKDDIKEERAATDHRGEPVPLSWRELEALASVWHSQAVRAFTKLRSDGVIAEGHPFSPIEVPTVVPLFEPIGLQVAAEWPENSDKSLFINKTLKTLGHFLGVPLHCGVTSDPSAQDAAAEFLKELCGVRSEAEKQARKKVRGAIEERGGVAGIFIERASKSSKTWENTPPTPSSADADKGDGVNATDFEFEESLDFGLDFKALLFAAGRSQLTFAEGQLSYLVRLWRALTDDERPAAIKGIEDRLAIGYYPAYATTLKRYLREKLWTEQLRAVTTAAGVDARTREIFEQRLQHEFAEREEE